MKKKLLLIVGLLVPLCAYSEPIDVSKCNFTSDDKNEIYKILNSNTIYKDTKTKGMLCYGYEDNKIIVNIPINKGVPHGKVQKFYPNRQIYVESQYKKGLLNSVKKSVL